MDNSTKEINLHQDGLPDILPAYEDGIFQAVLTLPESAIALVSAISAFIDRPVVKVLLRNNDAPAREKDGKREQYDINCSVDDENGDQCNVEMMAHAMEDDNIDNDHKNLKYRSVFNLSHLHSNQPGKGKEFSKLVKSYQIMLCNYKVFRHDNSLVERFTYRNEIGIELCEATTSIFVDLTKAREIAKKPVTEMSDIESWVVFLALSNNPRYREIILEITKQKEGIFVAFETLQNISKNADERARFHSRRMWLQDQEHKEAVWTRQVQEKYEPIIAQKDAVIAGQGAVIADQGAVIADKDAKLADSAAVIADKDARLANSAAVIADKDARLADSAAVIADKDAKLADKDAIIAELMARLGQG